MPNTRRRRFSVQTNITNTNNNKGKVASSVQTNELSSEYDQDVRLTQYAFVSPATFTKIRSKASPIIVKINPRLEMLAESEHETTLGNSGQDSSTKIDKVITASSSNIDLFNMLNATENSSPPEFSTNDTVPEQKSDKHIPRSSHRETVPIKRERVPRQHRIKVRSPKRKQPNANESPKVTDINKVTIGTNVDMKIEIEVQPVEKENIKVEFSDYVIDNTPEEIVEVSNHSLDEMCRICHGGDMLITEFGPMISACACRGTVGRVHVKCLERWLTESGKSRCELCGTRYATTRVHRYGVPRALVMWLLSQNAKQLMVDSLGIMLMSPLAVLAAWLSGRTLAGLMTKDNEVAPWPLASTFVLACMTLVCYYCWIVSAVTRHALGWWIWYRSQYEVRLQTPETE